MTFSVIFLSLAGLFTAAHARKWNERPDRDQFFTEAGVQGTIAILRFISALPAR